MACSTTAWCSRGHALNDDGVLDGGSDWFGDIGAKNQQSKITLNMNLKLGIHHTDSLFQKQPPIV